MLDDDNVSFKRPSQAKEILRRLRKNKGAMVGLILLIFILLVVIFADVIVSYDAGVVQVPDNKLAPMSAEHPLGCDSYGRDVLSRLVHGARNSLLVAVAASISSCLVGCTLGAIAGYFGGIVDDIINRTSEAVRVIPQIVFAIALCAVFGGGILNLAIVLGISNTTVYTRMMRSQVLSIKERDYIMAGKLQGNSNFRLMFHHILPNSISPIIVTMTQQVGNTILSEAGLSFLGLGISKPTATWGALVNGGRSFLLTNPIYSLAPGIAIALLVICLNTLGDGVRDALDPRLRGEV